MAMAVPARYEVIAALIAFDHGVFNHGDIIDEQQAGNRIYQLLKAGLIRRLPTGDLESETLTPAAEASPVAS